MKEILFDDKFSLTQAVLEGRKTVTRRIIHDADEKDFDMDAVLPKYELGEVVAIAQSYESVYHECGLETMDMLVSSLKHSSGWSNKLFVKADLMPHHIKITGVKVERLQDISDEDCLKEGIYEDSGDDKFPPSLFYDFEGNEDDGFDTPREAFAALIDKVSGEGVWVSNPFVFVYEFVLVD